MSGGKSQTVSPRMVIADDISPPLSHIGCRSGGFTGSPENAAPRPGLVPYRKRTVSCCACSTRLSLGLVMAMLRRFLKALHSEDRGQDLAEYCLLTALVALVAVGILIHVSGGMQAVWDSANISLDRKSTRLNSSHAAADTPASTPSQ